MDVFFCVCRRRSVSGRLVGRRRTPTLRLLHVELTQPGAALFVFDFRLRAPFSSHQSQTALKVQLNEVIDSLTALPAIEFPSGWPPMPDMPMPMPNITVTVPDMPAMPDIASLWSDDNGHGDGRRAEEQEYNIREKDSAVGGGRDTLGGDVGKGGGEAHGQQGTLSANHTRAGKIAGPAPAQAGVAAANISTADTTRADDLGVGDRLEGLSTVFSTAARAAPSDSLSQTRTGNDESGGEQDQDLVRREDDMVKGTSFRQIWDDMFQSTGRAHGLKRRRGQEGSVRETADEGSRDGADA